MPFTITAAKVRDYLGIRDAEITPPADMYLFLIAGPNEAGKSSLLGALDAVFAGKSVMPAEPVRRGASTAEIRVSLDGRDLGDDLEDGTYWLRRTIKPPTDDGRIPTEIEIRGPRGLMRAPQTFLNRIIGARTLDPSAFLTGNKPEDDRRRLTLIRQAQGIDTSEVDGKIAAARAQRAEVGRDLERAKASFAAVPAPTNAPPTTRPLATIADELTTIETDLRMVGTVRVDAVTRTRTLSQAEADLAALEDERRRLEQRIAAARTRVEEAQVAKRNAEDAVARTATPERERELQERAAALREERRQADSAASWRVTAQTQDRLRANAQADVDRFGGQYQALTDEIGKLEAARVAMIEAAPELVPGLAVTDGAITYKGLPFAQASHAIRTRVALAVATHANPELRVVLVRDGGPWLDERALETLAAEAEAIGCQVFVERVGERDQGAIIIRDGEIVDQGAAGRGGQ